MNKFSVFVMVCGIAVSCAAPQQYDWRFVRQSPQYRDNNQRLKNFPSQVYQTQEIDFPGSAGAYMSMPTAGYQNAYTPQTYQAPQTYQTAQTYQQAPQPHPTHQTHHRHNYHPVHIRTQPPAPAVHYTTTTAAPSQFIEEEPIQQQQQQQFQAPFVPEPTAAETPAPIPTPTLRAPIAAPETPAPIPTPTLRAPAPAPTRRVKINRQPVQQHTTLTNKYFPSQEFIEDEELPQQQPARRVPVQHEETEEERLLREEQARNAHYSFGTSIDDKINDHSIQREEVREGLALRGMYSYSDGFFHRTVHYEADENGYRVVKEEVVPIGDGPQYDPNGTADVKANLHDSELNYSITADDFVRERKNKKPLNQSNEEEN